MADLTIVADIHAAEGQADRLRAALEGLVAPTLAEDGCTRYDLHVDDTDPGHFLFYETWESRDHWLAHREAPHMVAHKARNGDAIASQTVWEMTKLRAAAG